MIFNTNHKRKGLIGTIVVHAILIVIFIFFGMKYQDPPPEPGIAIVFGFDEQGSGGFKPVPKVTPQPIAEKEVVEEIPEPVKEVESPQTDDVKEEIMTQENEDSPIVAEQKRLKKEKELAEKKKLEEDRLEKQKLEKERIEREKIKAAQDEKKKNLDNMFSNFENSEDATGKDANQGDDGVDGYKGSKDGLENAKNFTGNGGVGNYGNYQLGNRKPKIMPKPIYDGADQGIVVVIIHVNKAGKVVFAEAGAKGSTTSDPQLLKRAKEAALKTSWQSDESASEKQEGKIIYNFTIEN